VSQQLNHALRLYLGADAKGGFQPIGCEERLQDAFPADHSRVKALIKPYLDVTHASPDWSQTTLAEETTRFTDILLRKFPELDTISARALANRWAFSWR
jgi:hypothetical protein